MTDDQYFYSVPADIFELQKRLVLRGEEARHCTKVLRKQIGDTFFVVDGVGHEHAVAITRVEKDLVECAIQETTFRPRELPLEITLAQALIKKDHFDWVAEKATELGVCSIIPMQTERSLVDPSANRFVRWQKILITAMKQSRRSVLPGLQDITSFKNIIRHSEPFDLRIICHERSDQLLDISSVDQSVRRILVLIGPEGGFTESEAAQAVECGFISVSLGARRLRAETAAIAAMSILSNISSRKNV
jgi:16S rRNA (uracil1498-N3)-methyltransferase